MYTVQLLITKGGLTLILRSHSRKHGFFCGFAVQISAASSIALVRSLKLLHTVRTKRRVHSGGTESFVGISRQKQHLRPLCGLICKCELYCLSKRSRHFIDQQVITFHTFRDLISLHRKNTFCSISQNYNFNEWGTRFQFVYSKFSSFFTEIWLEFCLIMWQKMVLGNCYSWRPSKVMSI